MDHRPQFGEALSLGASLLPSLKGNYEQEECRMMDIG